MWARIIDADGLQTVAEVVDFNPASRFTPEIASLFVPAEAGMVYMAQLVDDEWVPPPAPEPPVEPEDPEPPAPRRILQVTPPTFLLLFQPMERIAIRAARNYAGTDEQKLLVKAVLDDWFSIIDDPRLTMVDLTLPATKEGLLFLVSSGLLSDERRAEIEEGFPA